MKTIYIVYAFIVIVMVLQILANLLFHRSFEEQVARLNVMRAVNAASDAATEFMLWESQETPYGNVFIEPEVVWSIYRFTFLEGIGLNSRVNMEAVDYFFPGVIIAVNDGYFMRLMSLERKPTYSWVLNDASGLYERDRIPNVYQEEWGYSFTQKIPFARMPTVPTLTTGVVSDLTNIPIGAMGFGASPTRGPNDVELPAVPGVNPIIPAHSETFPVVIADTMNGRNLIGFFPFFPNNLSGTDGPEFFGADVGRYIRFQIDGGSAIPIAGSGHDPPAIARELLSALDYSMAWNAPLTSVYRRGGQLRIPAEVIQSFASESVTFVGPMVIAIADQFNWAGNSAMSFWTMSNTQIVTAARYYVYQRDGVLLYSLCNPYGGAYFLQAGTRHPLIPGGLDRPFIGRGLPGASGNQGFALRQGSRIHQIFSTQEAAAIWGAYPDLEFSDVCN